MSDRRRLRAVLNHLLHAVGEGFPKLEHLLRELWYFLGRQLAGLRLLARRQRLVGLRLLAR
jgi:hypothetical protein